MIGGLCNWGATRSQAQGSVGYGDWQLHLPTNRALALADTGPLVYVAAEDAFFVFEKELHTTRLLSRRDGLHDVGVRTVAYDSLTQQVLVAYRNANLDVLRPNGSIRNLNDILRKQLAGNNSINQISFHARRGYLAGSFGLVVLDMDRLEVRETYSNIGPGGAAVRTYASTILGDSLYVASSAGVLRGRLTDNLLDYRNWNTDPGGGQRDGDPYRAIATQNGHVYAGLDYTNLLRFTGREWIALGALSGRAYRQLTPSRLGLLVADQEKVSVLRADGSSVSYASELVADPRAVSRGRDGRLYIADNRNGLVVSSPDKQQFENFVTNAPATASAFNILPDASGRTTVFTGGFSDRYLQTGKHEGFFEFKDGKWTNITPQNTPDRTQYPDPQDLARGVRAADGTLYAGSYANGLLEWKGLGKFRLFNPTENQPNPIISALKDNPGYARITDVAINADGEVWALNRHPEFPNRSGVHLFKPASGQWRTVPYFPGAEALDRIALDEYGNGWLTRSRTHGTGLVAVDPTTGNYRPFTESSGGLPEKGSDTYDIVKDRRGAIWIATAKGVAVYDDPSLVFTADDPGFRLPIVRRGAGSNYPALFTETVRTLAVDGGNRKWFGTDAGLWLFNEDADEALLHFTTDNSPLPSNKIVDVAVNDKTGEVFVATEAGLVAYRGSSTITEGTPACAKVFPNPVRRSFTGQVGISGLANNAIVKITDVSGLLVYQTRASGGTLTWNLLDYNGRRVQSGVYLVLSSDADGKNGCISKIAVVEQ
ncbi:T9SS type A sorting domain-containing protein [Hymenobacter sp. J193]|uniref:type IX secretion system anionic LPS delivery protein PorZ n=1 Tax=Hymenobacter sp. J193 TaxID=2898429 RepID=UPI00215136BE|nr:T9SS type A sorting domain-containing protein [Hymenobacter sp. J193]MCR5887385.1 T9SS type A sorting domain-containing protein [Hymenobacter sp. J193]